MAVRELRVGHGLFLSCVRNFSFGMLSELHLRKVSFLFGDLLLHCDSPACDKVVLNSRGNALIDLAETNLFR